MRFPKGKEFTRIYPKHFTNIAPRIYPGAHKKNIKKM